MEHWQQLLLLAAAVALLAAACIRAVNKYKTRKHRDFTRKLETLLQPKETIAVICPQRGSRCILTNSRIIFERKGEFTAFPLKSIQRVQGKNKDGNRTTVPKNMVSMTIKADKEFILHNIAPEFLELAAQLQEKVKRQNEKKKQQKK